MVRQGEGSSGLRVGFAGWAALGLFLNLAPVEVFDQGKEFKQHRHGGIVIAAATDAGLGGLAPCQQVLEPVSLGHVFGDVAKADLVNAHGFDDESWPAVPIRDDVDAPDDGHGIGIVFEIAQWRAGRAFIAFAHKVDQGRAGFSGVTKLEGSGAGVCLLQVFDLGHGGVRLSLKIIS